MKFTKRNLRNITGIFEEKTGVDLNPAHRTRPRPSMGKLVLVAAVIAFCLAVPGSCFPRCMGICPWGEPMRETASCLSRWEMIRIRIITGIRKPWEANSITICRNKQQREGRCPSRETVENSIPYDGRLPCCSTC